MKDFIRIKAKGCIKPLVFLTAVAMAMYVLPLLMCGVDNGWILWEGEYYKSDVDVYSGYLITFLIGAALLIPIWAANYKMSVRSLDVYYSLPIPRRKLLFINYMSGFAVLLIAYTAAYIAGAFAALVKFPNAVHIHYIWFYFALIIPTYIVYSISFFMFTRANTTPDGVAFVILSSCVLVMLIGTLFSMGIDMPFNEAGYGSMDFFTFSPVIFVERNFYFLINASENDVDGADAYIVSSAILSVFSALSTFGLFYTEKRAKAENANQISDSPFGYRAFIPFYAVTFYIIMGDMEWVEIAWIYSLIFLSSYALSALYRRTLKIGKKSLFVLLGCLAVGLIYCVIKHAI